MKIKNLSLCTAVALLSGHYAYAQNAELEKTVLDAEEDSSIRSTTIDAMEIELQGLDSANDIVRRIPGVQVSDNGDRFNDNGFNIRGVEADDVAITVDGIQLGESLNPDTFQPYGVFGANRGFIDPELVKSITIVKGPSSVLSGSGALGGSVAMTTKDTSDFLSDGEPFAGRLKLGYDDRDEETLISAAIAGSAGIAEALLMVVQREGQEMKAHGSGLDIDGYQRGQADPFENERTSVLARLNFQFTDNQRLGFIIEDATTDTVGFPRSRERAPDGSGSLNYYNFSSEDESSRTRYGVFYELNNIENPFFNAFSMSIDTLEIFNQGVLTFAYDVPVFFGGVPGPDGDILRAEDRSYEQETLDIMIDFEKEFGETIQHKLVYGLALRETSVANELFDRRYATADPNSELTNETRDPSWVPGTDRSVASIYALDVINLTETLTLTAGLRYEDTSYSPKLDENFADPTGQAVTDSSFTGYAGQLGLDYQFIENHTLSLLFAQGYRAPTTQDVYLDVQILEDDLSAIDTEDTFDNWVEIANPNLEPETAESIEFAYIWNTDFSQIQINVFSVDYDNKIENVSLFRDLPQTVLDPNTGEPTNIDSYNQVRNTGKQNVKGIEFASQFSLSENLSLDFSYSSIEGEHKTSLAGSHDKGDEMYDISPDSATLGLDYRSSDDVWGISGYINWIDRKEKVTYFPSDPEYAIDPESGPLSFRTPNNFSGPAQYPGSSTVLNMSAFFNVTDNFVLTANFYNLTDEKYTRWEVIKNVRAGTGGFFSGASRDSGVDRFSEPGRSFAISATYSF